MTYHQEEEDGSRRREADPDLTIRIHGGDDDDNNGDYVNLQRGPQQEEEEEPSPPPIGATVPVWDLVKLAVTLTCLGILGFSLFQWIGPPFFEKVIIPMINWERDTFSTPVLAVLVFASVALFPTLLLPSSPSMWVGGMTFGYGFGFLLIIPAVAVGTSLPFFIGSIFHNKVEEWLEKYPKRAAVLRAAGGGNWFDQFKAVALIRISPFPYIIYNYCAVATNVKYWPYLLGSLVGTVPDIYVSIYTGILILTLANASDSHKKHTPSASEIVLNVVGFCIAVGTVIFFTVYGKRRLRELQEKDSLLLQ